LERLNLPFRCVVPDIDESVLAGESPEQQVLRLAAAKAAKVAYDEPTAIIIGSDQLAELNGEVLGKPGNHENACRQLKSMSGRCVRFFTGVCLLNVKSGHQQLACALNDVYFRQLPTPEIERYLLIEQPYGCAGSFKSEALGITLIEKIHGPDPTALIGLPLIKLAEMLRNEGYKTP